MELFVLGQAADSRVAFVAVFALKSRRFVVAVVVVILFFELTFVDVVVVDVVRGRERTHLRLGRDSDKRLDGALGRQFQRVAADNAAVFTAGRKPPSSRRGGRRRGGKGGGGGGGGRGGGDLRRGQRCRPGG